MKKGSTKKQPVQKQPVPFSDGPKEHISADQRNEDDFYGWDFLIPKKPEKPGKPKKPGK